MRRAFFFIAALAILASPTVIYAAGPHDNDCTECHSLHDTQGNFSFGVAPNQSEKYTATGQTVSGTDALCLGCHNEDEGIMPIHLTKSHPVGVKPKKAFVPQEVLGNNGELTCGSCHDPHPSNPNYKYLRVGTNDGRKMGAFCAYCHEAMVDKNEL
ncbi:MAG: cytochrome c3 family protein [bacterium]|nr:cytochrome c3 family protein [bacterium]MDT8364905.1 cytochrome c3 family protein [bacterium]